MHLCMADLWYDFLFLSLCGQGWDLGKQVYLYIISWTFSYEEKDILLVEKLVYYLWANYGGYIGYCVIL
jgi:hypothetical protein